MKITKLNYCFEYGNTYLYLSERRDGTKDGTDELVDYFLAAVGEAISSGYEKRTVIKGNEEIKNYYFYTVDQEDLL